MLPFQSLPQMMDLLIPFNERVIMNNHAKIQNHHILNCADLSRVVINRLQTDRDTELSLVCSI